MLDMEHGVRVSKLVVDQKKAKKLEQKHAAQKMLQSTIKAFKKSIAKLFYNAYICNWLYV